MAGKEYYEFSGQDEIKKVLYYSLQKKFEV